MDRAGRRVRRPDRPYRARRQHKCRMAGKQVSDRALQVSDRGGGGGGGEVGVADRPRRRRRRRPAPGWTRSPARPSRAGCLSTQTTTRSPAFARDIACRTASISSRTISSCLQRAPVGHRRADALGDQLRGLAALPPAQRRVLADDHARRSAAAATAPSSRMSSSRRSPAVAMTPIREGRPSSLVVRDALPDPVHEVAEHLHARCVVAVVDDDLHAVDLDLVEPAGGEVVARGEGPQPLPDVVQRAHRRRTPRPPRPASSARSSGPGRRTSRAAGGSRPAASRGGRA